MTIEYILLGILFFIGIAMITVGTIGLLRRPKEVPEQEEAAIADA